VWQTKIHVYTFSATSPGNFAMAREYDSLLPRSFNHQMGHDMIAPLIYPWFWRPGYTLRFDLTRKGLDTFLGAPTTRVGSCWRALIHLVAPLDILLHGTAYQCASRDFNRPFVDSIATGGCDTRLRHAPLADAWPLADESRAVAVGLRA
jgi:hypothetical protein